MSLRIALLSGALLTNLVVGISSAVVPQVAEHIADRKLEAVIVDLTTGPDPIPHRERANVGKNLRLATAPPADAPISTVPVPATAATSTVPATPSISTPPAITRAAVDARLASPGAVPPAAVTEAIEDEFHGKGIARASNDQQLLLAKAVCSALDYGSTREEILTRALQEDGTKASGVTRFIEVAIATTCPEYRER